ncbi:hypothetical protein SAMN04488518_11791 [Pseudovibrio ascidiaceicola]|uniref:Uncharacterized protein n=1 Tax=Pseudovibrio ascidiaceicola TaxID=285279 RepID=A0A1I4F6R0_9HYPH|nr:hypothetical protein [Pseudovibrio ascidiaceicola]SFL12980.1 hypothetical protein SAMN04488518_11791 [Pseudovibrio ascidiaceicola]
MSVQDASSYENDLKFVEAAFSGLKNQSLQDSVEEYKNETHRTPRFSYTENSYEHASKNTAIMIAYGLAGLIGLVCTFWILVHSGILSLGHFPSEQFDTVVERVITVLSGFLTFIFGYLFNQKLEEKNHQK